MSVFISSVKGCEWKLLYFIKRHIGIIIFSIVIIIGLIYFSVDRSLHGEMEKEDVEDVEQNQLVQLDEEVESENAGAEELDLHLFVDIKGAIKHPDVYKMNNGDRVIDIISRAGGFLKQADETAINLAQKLQDEMVIIVPKEGENPIDTMVITTDGGGQDTEGKVKLNEATQAELETLNGIGPSKAQAIIDYREEHGPFQTVEDVLEVSGIGEKTLDHLKDDLIVP